MITITTPYKEKRLGVGECVTLTYEHAKALESLLARTNFGYGDQIKIINSKVFVLNEQEEETDQEEIEI
jgi:hypothetical protein